MPFTDIEHQAVKKEVEAYVESRRPPVHLRSQVDIAYRINNQTVDLFQVRPTWQGKPGELTELPIARITYTRSQDVWKLYCQRANLRWELYEETKTLDDALEIVSADRHGGFWG